MTFLPGFVPHGYPVAATVVLFGAVFIVLNVAYFLLLLALAGRVSAWMGTPERAAAHGTRDRDGAGGFGVRLAVES